MNNEQIMVSIFCCAFNHEKYIRKCLEGFVRQKTSFAFEVLIHDDASTDGTAAIIQEYAEKYPNIFRPVFQKENQYSKGVKISKTFLLPLARGKYAAICEGDDYWCDENKLQLQYEAMEQNPDCHLCVHTVQGVSEAGNKVREQYPNYRISTGKLSPDEFMSHICRSYAFQTSSYFRQVEDYRNYLDNLPDFAKNVGVGDVPWMMYCATLGPVYYINKVMSCYRMDSIGSWSQRNKNDQIMQMEHRKRVIEMYEKYNTYTGGRFAIHIQRAISPYEVILRSQNMDAREKLRLYMQKEYRAVFHSQTMRWKVSLIMRAYAQPMYKLLKKIYEVIQ